MYMYMYMYMYIQIYVFEKLSNSIFLKSKF